MVWVQAVNSGRYPRKLQKGSEEAIQDSRIHRETENHCVQWGFGPGWGTLGDSIEDTFDLFTPREMRELEFVFFNYLGHCLKAASGSSSPWSWFGCPCVWGRGSSQVVSLRCMPTGVWTVHRGVETAISTEMSLRFILLWNPNLFSSTPWGMYCNVLLDSGSSRPASTTSSQDQILLILPP